MIRKSIATRQNDFSAVCSNCTTRYSCCHETTPPVTRERRRIIESFLRKEGMKTSRSFEESGYVFPRLHPDGYCIFHDKKTRRCRIHPVKPETCVAGPITFDINWKTGKIEWFIKMENICRLAKIVYEDKTLLRQHSKTARKEITRLLKQIDFDALKEILKKDEPETFKIGDTKLQQFTEE